jgi:hypothetical protein
LNEFFAATVTMPVWLILVIPMVVMYLVKK